MMVGVLRRVAGYTLIELLAVLALLSLLTALAVPHFADRSQWHLDIASRRMAADLRLLRQTAINSGISCRVDFYIYHNHYTLRLPEGSRSVNFREEVQFDGTTTFDGTPPVLSFNHLGRPHRGGTIILKTSNAYRYIIVTPVTGRVRVSQTPPQHW